jgi:predicted DNA-binding antitoxin AbrB/MazE fold protein
MPPGASPAHSPPRLTRELDALGAPDKTGTAAVRAPRATIMVVRLVEANYENGMLHPLERLGLRPGERVRLIVIRQPDPGRWDLTELAKTGNGDDLPLAEQGLAEWASSLEATERS